MYILVMYVYYSTIKCNLADGLACSVLRLNLIGDSILLAANATCKDIDIFNKDYYILLADT
jgi:hypothetical protein